jgi:hypothetical protein
VPRLPMILAVHFQALYESENEVWDRHRRPGTSAGDRGRTAYALDRQSLTDSCLAGLEMHDEAAGALLSH